MMRDRILESLFLDTALWKDAISHGVEKHMAGDCLERLADPHVRADLCIAIGEGRYRIKPPHTGYRRKDDGSERMFLANEPQDRLLLNVIYKWLMTNESKMIHPACKSYQNGIGIGKIVKEISGRLKCHGGERSNGVVGRKFDIHKYFESIGRERIHHELSRVQRDFGESSILDLLHEYYDSDIYFDSRERKLVSAYQGIKQGCAVSSWLANVLLYSLDEELSKRGGLYVRYSDDILYIGDDYEEVTEIIHTRLAGMGLDLNRKKILDIREGEHFSFLGFDICGSEITLSRKWVKSFQREIDRRTIRNKKLIQEVRKSRQTPGCSKDKLLEYGERAARKVMRFLIYGNGRFSWATEVLPVINNKSDIRQLTLYCLDAIRAVMTGHTDIGGLGKSARYGIQRGKGKNVRSNMVATDRLMSEGADTKQISGFLSLMAVKKVISDKWLVRTLAVNLLDTARHPLYGETEDREINKRNRDEIISELESLYAAYRDSIPDDRRMNRFYAYSLDEMTPEMLLKGSARSSAFKMLEDFLVSLGDSSLLWEDESDWFWQSQRYPELVLLREWFNKLFKFRKFNLLISDCKN